GGRGRGLEQLRKLLRLAKMQRTPGAVERTAQRLVLLGRDLLRALEQHAHVRREAVEPEVLVERAQHVLGRVAVAEEELHRELRAARALAHLARDLELAQRRVREEAALDQHLAERLLDARAAAGLLRV